MSVFRFKQFTIVQEAAAMKVGTDGVLLGAWATPSRTPQHILDIGTGTGVIALMMAQRFADARIEAIEYEELACQEAIKNCAASPWTERISVMNGDFLTSAHLNTGVFDLIVCNPPYFNKGWPVEDAGRKSARDAAILPHAALLQRSARILHPDGAFCLILPFQESQDFIKLSGETGWHLSRYTEVTTKPGKTPKRVLLQFVRQPAVLRKDMLCIHTSDGVTYTADYRALTSDFYLAF